MQRRSNAKISGCFFFVIVIAAATAPCLGVLGPWRIPPLPQKTGTLSWDTYTTNGITPDLRLNLYSSTNLTNWTLLASLDPTNTSYIVSLDGPKAFYLLSASNSAGEVCSVKTRDNTPHAKEPGDVTDSRRSPSRPRRMKLRSPKDSVEPRKHDTPFRPHRLHRLRNDGRDSGAQASGQSPAP